MIYIGITGFVGALMCGCTYFFDFKEKRSKKIGLDKGEHLKKV